MAGTPGSPHTSRYRPGVHGDSPDGRLRSPVFDRNCPPIIAELARWLTGRTGPVLEIGAGTGQHATAFSLAFPDLDWWPSDPDPDHRRSIAAWAAELRAPGLGPLDVDAASDWARQPDVKALGPLNAVVSLNVIHIAPIDVARGIVRGASTCLGRDGLLMFYGPFRIGGTHTGPGNLAFDAGLRAEDPEWGVRDVDDISAMAEKAGLRRAALVPMPSDNRFLIFRKP